MKRFIVLVGILLLFLMGIAMLLPSKISVAKTIIINSPKNNIAIQVNDFKNWEHWFPVVKSKMATLKIQDGQTAIISRNSGKDMLVRFVSQNPDSVAFHISIPSGLSVNYTMTLQELPDHETRVNMIVNTNLRWYPWERAKGVFMDKITGPQYEEALKNLKDFCER